MDRKIDYVYEIGHSGHQLDTIQFSDVTLEQFRSYKLDTIFGEGKAGKKEYSHKGTKTRRINYQNPFFTFVPWCLRG